MAKLFTNIAHVKEFVSNDFVNVFDAIDPYLKMAESDLINRWIGKDMFDEMVTFWNNGSPASTEPKATLLTHIRNIIAHNAMRAYVPVGQVQMSETGVHIQSSADKKTAFEWQIKNLEDSFKKVESIALEDMLVLLLSDLTTFATWKSSSLYADMAGHLVNTASSFSKYAYINNSQLFFVELLPDIRNAEQLFIIPAISQEYYDALITEIKAGSISADNEAVLKYLRPALSLYAKSTFDQRQKINTTTMEHNANRFLARAIDYLNTNASASKFSEYYTSECYTAPASYSNKSFDNSADNKIFVV
jgi:hypothetical protein